MNEPTQDPGAPLRQIVLPRLDIICDAFRFQWMTGRRPRIEEYLSDPKEPQRSDLLAQLIDIDREFRRRVGEQPALQDYTNRFPGYTGSLRKLSDNGNQETVNPTLDPLVSTIGPVGNPANGVLEATANLNETPAARVEDTLAVASLSASPAAMGKFGDYELLEKIAQGGMGVVYKARQAGLNRLVALKMILAGQFANDDAIRRFYGEAEAAAKLKHPNIVRIHDVGEHDGQHYFSMDYLEGESLADLVRQNPLTNRDAATYTKQIADAMQYAHEQGILHRDLKPANVLLDHNGAACITDFGLAKLMHAESDLTATGQVLGTPSYMPPEQAAGNTSAIDARSDVYSIGAILYCSLTGRGPFNAATIVETVRQVIDCEPVVPRQINPSISRDLETICLKCLEKQPQRRYASARELSQELGRFLNGQPIHARPVSRTERLVKWMRRRPATAGLIAVTVLSALAVLGVTIAYNGRLQTNNAALQDAVTNEAIQKTIAQQQASHAAQQSEVALKTLSSVIDDIQNQLINVPAAHQVRGRLLEEAIKRLDELARSLENAPEANRYLADAHLQLGRIFLLAGKDGRISVVDEAAEQCLLANEVAKKLVEQDAADAVALTLLSMSHETLGDISKQRGELASGLQHLENALKIFESVPDKQEFSQAHNAGVLHQKIGSMHEVMGQRSEAVRHYEIALNKLQTAAANDPGDAILQTSLSFAYDHVGDMKLDVGDAVSAQQLYEKSFKIAKSIADHFPDDFRFQRNLALRYGLLAKARTYQNDRAGAISFLHQQRDICLRLFQADSDNAALRLDLARACKRFAEVEMQAGSLEAADKLVQEAVSLLEVLSTDDPNYVLFQSDLAALYRVQGSVREHKGDANAAREAYEKCLAIRLSLSVNDPDNFFERINVALTYEYLGDTYLILRDLKAAEEAFQTSLEIRQTLVESDPASACNNRNLSVAYNKFVFLNVQLGKLAEAREAAQKGLAIAKGIADANPLDSVAQQDVATSLEYLGNVDLSAGDIASARDYYEQCALIRERLAQAAPQDASIQRPVSVIYCNLGVLSMELRDWEAARGWFEKNLRIKKQLAQSDPTNMSTRTELANSYERMGDVMGELGDHRRAADLFAEGLEIARQIAERDPANRQAQSALSAAQRKVGLSHLTLGDPQTAIEAFQTSLEVAHRQVEADAANIKHKLMLADIYENLGDAYRQSNDTKEARDWFDKSLAVREILAQAFPDNQRFQQQLSDLSLKAAEIESD